MELVSPAVIAYWSALNHYGMTEQLPRTAFVATNHPVRRPPGEVLGISYKVVSLRPEKFFGVVKDWIGEMPFTVTDREKTIIDGLDLPQYIGGVAEVAKGLSIGWTQLDESKLRKYAAKIGNSAVAKRLGFLMEALGLETSMHSERQLPLLLVFLCSILHFRVMENTIEGGDYWLIWRLRHDYNCRTPSNSGRRRPSL